MILVRVLICPESFLGALTAVQAAQAIANGWGSRAPWDELTLAPLSDGGPGFLDVISGALGGISVGCTVADPLGRDVPATVLLVESDGVRSAYIEAAQACGLHLLGAAERDPWLTSSYGVGQLIGVALAEGATRIVVGLGGSATNDAGAGLLAGLGVGDGGLNGGGAALSRLREGCLFGIHEVRARLRDVDLVFAAEDDMPLLGSRGPSATSAVVKGASPGTAHDLEGAIGWFTDLVAGAVPPGKDLITGLDRRLEREPGAGASGGIGYALLLLGGRRVSAVGHVLEAWGFDRLLARHDLVLTGEACLDWSSLHGSVVAGVAEAAARFALPTVVLAGEIQVGRRETMAMGIAGAYAVADNQAARTAAAVDPVGTLAARAARLAATWSPDRSS